MNFLKISFLAIVFSIPVIGKSQMITQVLQAIKPSKPFNGTKILVKGSSVIQGGIGYPNNAGDFIGISGINSLIGIKKTGAGPFFINYEYLAKDELGIGVSIAYASAKVTSTSGIVGDLLNNSGSFSLTQIGVNTTYHIYTTDKIDPYVRAMVGLNITQKKGASTASNVLYSLPSAIGYQALVGMRYFVTKKVALVGEMAYSSLKFTANIGVAYKIK